MKRNSATTMKMFCGGEGFKMTPEMELYTIVCTSMLSDTHYGFNKDEQISRISNLIEKVDPLFAVKLALYARKEMYLREIAMVLTVEIIKSGRCNSLIRNLVYNVIQRVDEIPKLVSYYISLNGIKPKVIDEHVSKNIYKLSNQMVKGLRDVFESDKFDEYQYAKYNRVYDGIKIRDILFLVRPKSHTADKKALFEKIINNNLDTPYTWESESTKLKEISAKGMWENLIDSNRLPYMATLRNLANFVKNDVSIEYIDKVCNYLSNPLNVKKSKQFPFRYLSAYRILDSISNSNDPKFKIIENALDIAVKHSINNIPLFKNQSVLIASDVSGSMGTPVTEKSNIFLYDIGLLLSCLVHNVCNDSTIGIFGNTWKVMTDFPRKKVLSNFNKLNSIANSVGYSTNGYKIIEWMIKNEKKYNRVFIFTDCQMYNSKRLSSCGWSTYDNKINKLWEEYKKFNSNAKLYSFNLAPYGQSAFEILKNDVYLISGFSDKVFNMIESIENGEDIIEKIKDMKFK